LFLADTETGRNFLQLYNKQDNWPENAKYFAFLQSPTDTG